MESIAPSERFRRVGTGGIELCYQELGPPGGRTVLLVMGLGLGLEWWRDAFCAALVARGFRVVRFDNRDAGRSTQLDDSPGISPRQFLTRRARPVYTLGDMADDAAGLVETIAPDGVHIVGASLGAMIAQEFAVRHPQLTRSLVSIMGRPGDRRSGRMSPRMTLEFLRPRPADALEGTVRSFRRIGGVRSAQDDEDVRTAARRAAQRSTGNGTGGARQLAACVAERDRTADLRRLTVPALVVHGLADRVIRPSGGRATAAAIPDAELLEVPEMGHDLPRWVWPQLVEGIVATAARDRATT